MKKAFYLLFVFSFLLIISSCTKSASDLIGIWQMNELTYTGQAASHDHSLLSDYSYYGEASNINATFEFTENPNEFTSTGTYDVQIDTYYEGDTIVQNVDQMQWLTEGSWVKKGNKLILTPNDGSPDVEYEIVSINNTDMHLDAIEETTSNEGGVTVDHTLYVTNKFFKN